MRPLPPPREDLFRHQLDNLLDSSHQLYRLSSADPVDPVCRAIWRVVRGLRTAGVADPVARGAVLFETPVYVIG